MKLKPDQRKHFQESISWFKNNYLVDKYRLLNDKLPIVNPTADLQRLYLEINQLFKIFQEWPTSQLIEFDDSLIPCLKRALIAYRLYSARYSDSFKTQTTNAEILQQLEDKIAPLDALLLEPWVLAAQPSPMPRLVDLISTQTIDRNAHAIQMAEREYDEKFHILQAPRLFLEDLKYFRQVCGDRGTNVIVAYLDIDDFKKFNTSYGETEVDRLILPRFMQTLESSVFHHGYAYRYGGDEYVILLPSLSSTIGIQFLDDVRKNIADLNYRNIEGRTTVSVGFCCIDEDAYLTDREIENRANKAKNFAKGNGKNCIATYSGPRFEGNELRVVAPKAS